MLMVLFGWVLFRAVDLPSALSYLQAMFGIGVIGFADVGAIFQCKEFFVILAAGILCSTPIFLRLRKVISERIPNGEGIATAIGCSVQLILFLVSVSFIVMDAHNPFIYFNF